MNCRMPCMYACVYIYICYMYVCMQIWFVHAYLTTSSVPVILIKRKNTKHDSL